VAAALEYRDASRQRASSSQYYSQDCDARTPHEPPLLPVSMPPVPALPQRRGPSCVCSLACIALLGCLSFSACFFLQLSYLNLDVGGGGAVAALQRRRDYARHMRQQQHKLGTSTPQVRLGLWDENLVVTPLQLTVALSLALGVDERSIRVVEKGSHFFNVLIDGEGDWLVETINAAPPASSFFHVLNAQAAVFGARLVVSNQAVLVAPNGTAVIQTRATSGSWLGRFGEETHGARKWRTRGAHGAPRWGHILAHDAAAAAGGLARCQSELR